MLVEVGAVVNMQTTLLGLFLIFEIPRKVADGVGFEPTRSLHPCRFSRPFFSTIYKNLKRSRTELWLISWHFTVPELSGFCPFFGF
jgi:hypothetical protein